MASGYALILVSATLWGGSVIFAKHLLKTDACDPLTISQFRVSVAWLCMFAWLGLRSPAMLRVRIPDLARFALLGVIGIAGTNFLVYYAVQGMEAAAADIIQFTAPVFVAAYLWLRGREPMDGAKALALLLAVAGNALAAGALGRHAGAVPADRVAAAGAAALCDTFLFIYGKRLADRYPMQSYLHYAFLGSALFWLCVNPPWRLAASLPPNPVVLQLVLLSLTSTLIPYVLFFCALKMVSASRAAIVSTWEPISIALGAWAIVGEALTGFQAMGIALVVAAIVIVEAFPGRRAETDDAAKLPPPEARESG